MLHPFKKLLILLVVRTEETTFCGVYVGRGSLDLIGILEIWTR